MSYAVQILLAGPFQLGMGLWLVMIPLSMLYKVEYPVRIPLPFIGLTFADFIPRIPLLQLTKCGCSVSSLVVGSMPIFHAFARADDMIMASILLILVVTYFGVDDLVRLVLLAARGSSCVGIGALVAEGGFRMLASLMDLLVKSSCEFEGSLFLTCC